MINKLVKIYMDLRQKYPNIVSDSAMHNVRPLLWRSLDFVTLDGGCKVYCAGKWPLNVEWKRKVRNDFEQWEKEFIDYYIASLRPDDVVFDIGAEYGEWAALAATVVSGSQVHIFEPNLAAWSRIKKIWHHNKLSKPGGCWAGFVANQTSSSELNIRQLNRWPEASLDSEVKFETLLDEKEIPTITIDEYIQISGAKPTILMMDIEGAEVLALEGAINTLQNLKPLVFVSIHPTMIHHFDRQVEDIVNLFSSVNYRSHLISTDHEEHWVFWHEKSQRMAISL